MKILKRIIIASMMILFVAVLSFTAIFIYDDQYKQREIYQETSPDGNYTVFLYQIGSPQWSFGPVKAKLVLIDTNGRTIDAETFSLANDGTEITDGNIVEIIWEDNQVEMRMREFDSTQRYAYFLEYTDS